MAANKGTGCIQGQIDLRIPHGDPTVSTTYLSLPIPGVKVELTSKGASSTAGASNKTTDVDGSFCFDGLMPGPHKIWYPKEIVWGGTTFPAVSTNRIVDVDAPDGGSCAAGGCARAATFEYVFDGTPLAAIAGTLTGASDDVRNSPYLTSTLDAIQDIRTALQDMTKFPYSGPSDSNGHAPVAARSSRTPIAATSSIRGGVQSALADLGLTDTMTDADLARLFPSQTDDDGDVTYKWAGPSPARRASTHLNGARHVGDVLISGGLALFHQQAQAALREVRDAFAIIKPINGDSADEATIATQKAIVLDTLQSIVDEPEREDGMRRLAIDAHFNSLLKDKITVDRDSKGNPIKVKGNVNALKYMLGIASAIIADQTTESQVTEWQRAEDAVRTSKAAWTAFKAKNNLKLGERLQELDGYFGALSEGVGSARNMMWSVRFTSHEQATIRFTLSSGGSVTTDDLLSMVEDLATNIGPKYITDWKGRGIGTIEGRARTLKATITAANGLNKFPFDNARVKSAFGDIVRLLAETEAVCQRINAGI